MADAAIVNRAIESAPKDYTLGASEELFLKAVRAVMDGSGTGQAYLPALQLIAPDGTVMWTAVPVESVAAGGSVDVSWFPGVEEAIEQAVAAAISALTSSAGTLTVTNPTGPTANVDLPATGVVAGSYGDAADAVTITVDAYGRATALTSVPIAGGGTVVASDGWVPDTSEAWTYASFTAGPPAAGTFTVPGDVRAKYAVGTRIKLVQTTTRYYVVSAAPTYDGTNTTVTISGGTDYTLANAAISGNAHSYVGTPQGYPGTFNFAPGTTGLVSETVNLAAFAVSGRVMTVFYDVTGTSNSTAKSFTLPIVSASTLFQPAGLTINNGTLAATAGRFSVAASSGTGNLGQTASGSAWTASGTWRMAFAVAVPI